MLKWRAMKTTVEVSDDLYRRAKAEAALQGRKLKDLVEEGLRLVLEGPRKTHRHQSLEHFPLMLIHSLRGGRNWRILVDKLYEGANEFCARGPVSFAQPLFAAVL
jgi:hypothetical protein